MATPVDPILTTIERYRIAYVAFASLHKTDGWKAGLEKGREVTQTDEDAHEAAGAGWGEVVGKWGVAGFCGRGRGEGLSVGEPIGGVGFEGCRRKGLALSRDLLG